MPAKSGSILARYSMLSIKSLTFLCCSSCICRRLWPSLKTALLSAVPSKPFLSSFMPDCFDFLLLFILTSVFQRCFLCIIVIYESYARIAETICDIAKATGSNITGGCLPPAATLPSSSPSPIPEELKPHKRRTKFMIAQKNNQILDYIYAAQDHDQIRRRAGLSERNYWKRIAAVRKRGPRGLYTVINTIFRPSQLYVDG
jgi:hypothetical protein